MRHFNNNKNSQEIWSISTTNMSEWVNNNSMGLHTQKFLWCQYRPLHFQSFYAITSHCLFSKVSMSKREIGLAHSSPPCHPDTPQSHAHCICASIYLSFFLAPFGLLESHFDSDLLDPLLDLHVGSKCFFPPQLWQVLPKAGHSPLLWECPQYLQSV